jgi:hypothetical protein
MRKVVRSGILCIALAATLLSIPVLNAQQRSKDVPAAPVPAQIGAAKRVFISYNGGINGYVAKDDRTYDHLYAAMKDWGRYELVAAPADADLVLEASLVGVNIRLAVLDPKTHVVLWAFAHRMGGFRGMDDEGTITKIVDDFKKLDARAKAAAESAQK